ncbi:Protein PTP-4 b [Aphelenchoides avenae]|nr:Protein PTP-4 b [Aphelenchus avenae]
MVSIFVAFTFYFRKRCFFVKAYLKKTRKIRSHETVSLVYDASDGIRGETVPLSRFDEYYKELARNNNEGFRLQFEEVEAESGSVDEEEPGEDEEDSAEIRLKNRYLNIGAVGRTRIRIRSEVDGGGYINANYIDSCDEKNAYIATQAPLPHTFGDFWAMVWQEKCNLIVVITNLVESGRRKCDQYWPSKPASTLSFGNLQVAMTHEMPNANFVHRILTLKANDCNQEQYVFCHDAIRQLILHGIARQPIINFVHYVQFLQEQRLLDGRTRMQLQFDAICNCPHNPRCASNTSHVVLPGYHRAREFVIGGWESACPELWSTIWKLGCQTVVFVGTEDDMSRYLHGHEVKMNGTSHPSSNGHVPMKKAFETASPGVIVEQQTDGNVVLRCGDDELCVRTVALSRHSFEKDTWTEIERIQDEAIDYHSKQIMFLDPHATSTPYIFCVLQSAACQLEQERFVDVLQFLATYRFARCGCWNSQKDIEFVYDKILELIQMQRV